MAQLINESAMLGGYSDYIAENQDLFANPESGLAILANNELFESYIEKLLNESTIEDSQLRKTIKDLVERERGMYLEESTSLLSSANAIAYAVASFPILINIYADPLLSKVATLYTYDKPTMSIPRLRWVSKVIDENGVAQEFLFPTATQMVRPFVKEIDVTNNANLFALLGVNRDDFRISKRNLVVKSITYNDGTDDQVVDLGGLVDARGGFLLKDVAIDDGVYTIMGNVNVETGEVSWSANAVTPATGTVNFTTLKVAFRLFGNGNGRQVVKSFPKQDIIDVNMDIEDSFEVENIEEVIQDWKSLYNVDIINELKSFVRDQIKLNRDFDIAEHLENNIPYAKTIGQYVEVDFSKFKTEGDAGLRPATVQDIFKSVIPPLTALIERMRRQNNMEVKYIVTGVDTAAVLKSLQEFALKMVKLEGEMGTTGTVGDFNKLEVIESYAVADDLIHVITDAPSMSQSSIVMVMYKPLYIITETTNSIKRTFIKSRNWIGIVRPEGIGTIKLKEYKAYFGQY